MKILAQRSRAAGLLAGREVRYARRERGRDGSPRDFEVHYVPNFDAHGVVSGYFVMLNDVTARKKDKEETEEQLAFLRERDCHKVQGYLFGRPMPAEELAPQLTQRGRAAA